VRWKGVSFELSTTREALCQRYVPSKEELRGNGSRGKALGNGPDWLAAGQSVRVRAEVGSRRSFPESAPFRLAEVEIHRLDLVYSRIRNYSLHDLVQSGLSYASGAAHFLEVALSKTLYNVFVYSITHVG
jgi:hypothetical protein